MLVQFVCLSLLARFLAVLCRIVPSVPTNDESTPSKCTKHERPLAICQALSLAVQFEAQFDKLAA